MDVLKEFENSKNICRCTLLHSIRSLKREIEVVNTMTDVFDDPGYANNEVDEIQRLLTDRTVWMINSVTERMLNDQMEILDAFADFLEENKEELL